jgi:hypothetical protein
MTSLPISSKTSTFHAAPSAGAAVASWLASSCASMSVMGALRFSMRLMLARTRQVSCIHSPKAEHEHVPICLSRNVTAMVMVV